MDTIQFAKPITTFNDPTVLDSQEMQTENTSGFILGLIILIALLGLFFYYLIPYIQQAFTATPHTP